MYVNRSGFAIGRCWGSIMNENVTLAVMVALISTVSLITSGTLTFFSLCFRRVLCLVVSTVGASHLYPSPYTTRSAT